MRLRNQTTSKAVVFVVTALLLSNCAGKKGEDKTEVANSKSDKAAPAPQPEEMDLSTNLRTAVSSNSNNPLSGFAVSRSKAEESVQKLEAAVRDKNAHDQGNFLGLMTAQRLAGMSTEKVIATGKRLAELEMKKNVERELPDAGKLEIALTAIRANQFGMAEHFIGMLLKSKNARIRAGAYNAEGIMAMHDGRLPEAMVAWNEALKLVNDYQPALFNAGFVALKHGDYKTAKQMLGGLQENWFAASGLIVAERLSGDSGKASSLCDRVLGKEPHYKVGLYNCGLLEFQNVKNYDKAKSYLNRAVKEKGGKGDFDERAYKFISKMEIEKSAPKKPDAASPPAAKPAAEGKK